MDNVSIGFRAKTGRAIAIALCGKRELPDFVGRWQVWLYDPAMPATGQPHHETLELSWPEAQKAVRPLEARIEEVADEMLSKLVRDLESTGRRVGSVGVVGSPDRKLDKIGNSHIRAHAAEGILFRRVIELAAKTHQLSCRSFSDRDFDAVIASELRRKPEDVKSVLTAIGRSAGKPWRADERAAAAAAWAMLA